MNTNNLVFVGIKGSAVALNRATGEIAWQSYLRGSGYVNLVLEGENLYATSEGEIYCVNAATGQIRWHNKLKGFGLGLASIAVLNGSDCNGMASVSAEEQRRAQQQSSDPIV